MCDVAIELQSVCMAQLEMGPQDGLTSRQIQGKNEPRARAVCMVAKSCSLGSPALWHSLYPRSGKNSNSTPAYRLNRNFTTKTARPSPHSLSLERRAPASPRRVPNKHSIHQSLAGCLQVAECKAGPCQDRDHSSSLPVNSVRIYPDNIAILWQTRCKQLIGTFSQPLI